MGARKQAMCPSNLSSLLHVCCICGCIFQIYLLGHDPSCFTVLFCCIERGTSPSVIQRLFVVLLFAVGLCSTSCCGVCMQVGGRNDDANLSDSQTVESTTSCEEALRRTATVRSSASTGMHSNVWLHYYLIDRLSPWFSTTAVF